MRVYVTMSGRFAAIGQAPLSGISSIFGGLGILAGILTLATPGSWDARIVAFHSEEIAELATANPLRWFHIFWRFVRENQTRKIVWGLDQIATGTAFVLGVASLAIAANVLLGFAIFAVRLFRKRPISALLAAPSSASTRVHKARQPFAYLYYRLFHR